MNTEKQTAEQSDAAHTPPNHWKWQGTRGNPDSFTYLSYKDRIVIATLGGTSPKDAEFIAKVCNQSETDKATIATLSAALKFYADRENWKENESGIGMYPSDAEMDCGGKARTALEKTKITS